MVQTVATSKTEKGDEVISSPFLRRENAHEPIRREGLCYRRFLKSAHKGLSYQIP